VTALVRKKRPLDQTASSLAPAWRAAAKWTHGQGQIVRACSRAKGHRLLFLVHCSAPNWSFPRPIAVRKTPGRRSVCKH